MSKKAQEKLWGNIHKIQELEQQRIDKGLTPFSTKVVTEEEQEENERKRRKNAIRKRTKKRTKESIILWSFILFMFIICISVWWLVFTSPLGEDELGWDEYDVMGVAMGEVEEQLWSPSTASYPELEYKLISTGHGYDGEYNYYKVWGIVDAQNAFGATVQNHFYVYLYCYNYPNYKCGGVSIT